MNAPQTTQITVPLSAAAQQAARAAAAAQASPEQGLRVYLNQLATWAVQRYLGWLAIPSDRQQTESAQPVNQALFDIADLVIPGRGRLECRPLRPDATELTLPPEVQGDRLGYVGVQFANSLQAVQLVGFLPADQAGDRETVPLSELQPLACLLAQLSPAGERESVPVQLQQWLAGVFESGWQALNEAIAPPTPGLAWRGAAVQRVRVLAGEPPLVLGLAVEPQSADELALRLRLQTLAAAVELPADLRVQVRAADGTVFRELRPAAGDRGLQYEFRARLGERFALAIQVGSHQQQFDFAA